MYLQTLFGALLYPNDMSKAISKSERQKRGTLNLVHKTLYSYSNNNLHNLLQKCQAFRVILAKALMDCKDDIFNLNIPDENDGPILGQRLSHLPQAHENLIPESSSQENDLSESHGQEDGSSATPRLALKANDAPSNLIIADEGMEPGTLITSITPGGRNARGTGPQIKGATSDEDINEGIKFLQKLLKQYDQ